MAGSRYYRVAGHVFSISADDRLLDPLTNYQPFAINEQEAEGVEPVFNLSVVDRPFEDKDKQFVFADTSEEDMPRFEIYRLADGWFFAVAPRADAPTASYIKVSADFHDAQLYIVLEQMPDYRFAINNAAMLLYAFSTVGLHTLEMHAAVVVKDGLGYLFLGKSGTGKSTHAQQWLKAFEGSWLLNDDNPVLRLEEENGRKLMRVYGSPWSGKTPCYKNESAEVGGVVKLSQAPHNVARVLSNSEAYAYMLSSSSGLKINPPSMDAIYDTISQMILSFKFFGLECLPNVDAAEVCYKAITDNK